MNDLSNFFLELDIDDEIINNNDINVSNNDEYDSDSVNIYWSLESFNTLKQIKEMICKSSLESQIITLMRYYIHIKDLKNEYDTWDMIMTDGSRIGFLHPIDTDMKKILILGFLEYLYIKMIFGNKSIVVDSELASFSFCRLFYDIIEENTYMNNWILSFNEAYIINTIYSKLECTKYNTKTIQYKLDIVKTCYFYVCRLIRSVKWSDLLKLESLIVRSMDVDLSILTKEDIRNIQSIFNQNRRLIVRILLVICHEILRIKSNIKVNWLSKLCNAKNFEEICLMFHSPILEINIVLSCININNRFKL